MSNTKNEKSQSFTTLIEKVERGMEMFYEISDWFLLIILDVVKEFKKSDVLDFSTIYPYLINEYGIDNLYLNRVKFKEATKEEVELANTLSMLRILMEDSFSQFEKGTLIRDDKNNKEVNKENDLEMNRILQITCLISLEEFIDRLKRIRLSVIDEDNYNTIISALDEYIINMPSIEPDDDIYLMLDDDLKLRDSKIMFMWFERILLLLKIIYFIVEYNSKRKTA